MRHWALFSRVPVRDVERLLETARRRTFRRGEVVFHEGDPANALHLVDRGRFAVRAQTQYGDSAILSVVGPEESFGELALLSPGAPRSATVSALEPAATLQIDQVDFARLLREHPATNEVLVAVLADRVRVLSAHLLEALHLPVETRVRRRLLELQRVYDSTTVPLTQDDLADLAGASRSTVNRVLRDDEQRGFLRLGRGRTELLDVEGLRRLAGLPPLA